jgi:hypothetical protein
MMTLLMGSPFSFEDVEVLRGALDSWCTEKRIEVESAPAQAAASAAIDLFQSGHNTAEKLLDALRVQGSR